MNKHTPGPWHIRYSEDRADAFIEYGDRSNITDTQSRLIAQCFMHSVEDNANATLMAASTDLLAALVLADANSKEPADEPWRVVVKAAIAKATQS